MVCPKQQGNNVCPKELEPICSRKTCFLGGTSAHLLSRNLRSFVQGNHVSLAEIHNCSSRMTILPSCMKAIHDEDFHCKKNVNPRPPTQKLKLSTILIYKNIKSQRYLTQSSQLVTRNFFWKISFQLGIYMGMCTFCVED